MVRQAAAVLFLFCSCVSFAPAQEKLDHANTYAVIAGVMQWQNNALTPFSKFNRKDQELYDTLQKQGVPAANMALLLDEQSTHAKMCQALEDICKKAKPGATLLFYYAGHGTLTKAGKICLCNYDFMPQKGKEKGLEVEEISSIVARAFKGKQVFLMGDFCYSGGLKQTAEALQRAGVTAVSLTSASASNVSTLNWTFTQTILDALHGESLADADGDGVITLQELANDVARAMKFREKQMYGYFNQGVQGTLPIAKVDPAKKLAGWGKDVFPLGEYVLATDKGKPRAGRIVGKREDRYIVEFYDYSIKRLIQTAAKDLKKIDFWTYPAGPETLAFWGDKTWKAKILKVEGDFHLITYPGWPSYWDEWVLCDRLINPAVANQPVVQVEWKGTWHKAQIMKIDNGQYHIRYFGFSSDWNETVAKERIKFGPMK